MSKCFASAVIAIAKAEVGYREKASKSKLDDKTANAGNKNWNKYAQYIDTEFPDFYNGKKNGYDWCDIFVDYCFIRAFGVDDAKRLLCQPDHSAGAGCTASYGYYKAAGRICKTPCIGAQIFYTKDGKSSYHTGLVIDVNDGIITTIEGNSGDQVRLKTFAIKSASILGFGVPDYDKEETRMKTINEIAREVIAGLWGNGAARINALTAAGYSPDIIQSEVNRICRGEIKDDAGKSDGDTYYVSVPKGVSKIEITLR